MTSHVIFGILTTFQSISYFLPYSFVFSYVTTMTTRPELAALKNRLFCCGYCHSNVFFSTLLIFIHIRQWFPNFFVCRHRKLVEQISRHTSHANSFQLMSSGITGDSENGNDLFFLLKITTSLGKNLWKSLDAAFSRFWQKISINIKRFKKTRGTPANRVRHTVWETLTYALNRYKTASITKFSLLHHNFGNFQITLLVLNLWTNFSRS